MLRSLTAAPRTRAQLAQLLSARGVPNQTAAQMLDRFTELGLIDDAEYARMWARSRHEVKQASRRVIREELRRKGVEDHDIESALEAIDDGAEHSAALKVAERKVRSTAGLERRVRERRVMAALLRRGYSSSVAASAMRAALQAAEEEDSEDSEDSSDVVDLAEFEDASLPD